jgi:hypothetical protein
MESPEWWTEKANKSRQVVVIIGRNHPYDRLWVSPSFQISDDRPASGMVNPFGLRGWLKIVIAGLGTGISPALGPVAAAYVLFLAVLGPVLARVSPRRRRYHRQGVARPSGSVKADRGSLVHYGEGRYENLKR